MALLNYTTTITVAKTSGEVATILAKAGARQVLTEYSPAGQPTGVAFAIDTPTGLQRYHLPVDVAAVHAVLQADRKIAPRYKTPDHAERVAWRILKDWLEAQLAIIESSMVAVDQVMLPYMASADGRTVYDLYLDQQLSLGTGGDAT